MWQLRRWVHIAGGSLARLAAEGPATPFQLEVSGDWQAAADEWTRRGCAYEAAIAQLGGDIGAVEAAIATFRQLGAHCRDAPCSATSKSVARSDAPEPSCRLPR